MTATAELTQFIEKLNADSNNRIATLEQIVAKLERSDAEKAAALTAAFATTDLSDRVSSLAVPVASLGDLYDLEGELIELGTNAPAAIRLVHGTNFRQTGTTLWVWNAASSSWFTFLGTEVQPVFVGE